MRRIDDRYSSSSRSSLQMVESLDWLSRARLGMVGRVKGSVDSMALVPSDTTNECLQYQCQSHTRGHGRCMGVAGLYTFIFNHKRILYTSSEEL